MKVRLTDYRVRHTIFAVRLTFQDIKGTNTKERPYFDILKSSIKFYYELKNRQALYVKGSKTNCLNNRPFSMVNVPF